jgi:hypothetical protein
LATEVGLAYATFAAAQESSPADTDAAKGMTPTTVRKLLSTRGYTVALVRAFIDKVFPSMTAPPPEWKLERNE